MIQITYIHVHSWSCINSHIFDIICVRKIVIGEYEELALAPLGILPEYQKRGIGTKLIEEGHKIAKNLGYHYSIVLGSDKYYTKFGYIPASQYGIIAPFEVPNEKFMAIKLNDTNKEITGVVKYAKEFGI